MSNHSTLFALRVIRNLTYTLHDGVCNEDGVFSVDRVVIEHESNHQSYIMCIADTGETCYQTSVQVRFIPTVTALCESLNIPVTEMDLCK